jgi:hypothetical protein
MNQSDLLPEFIGWMIVNPPGRLCCMAELPLPMSYVKLVGGDDCRGAEGSEYWYTWGALPREWIATAG